MADDTDFQKINFTRVCPEPVEEKLGGDHMCIYGGIFVLDIELFLNSQFRWLKNLSVTRIEQMMNHERHKTDGQMKRKTYGGSA